MARINKVHQIRAFQEFFRIGNNIEIGIVCKDSENPELRYIFDGEVWDSAAPFCRSNGIVINEGQAQQLCNDLFDLGIRPVGAAGSIGQLSATERHLNDMRKIAFSKLNIKHE